VAGRSLEFTKRKAALQRKSSYQGVGGRGPGGRRGRSSQKKIGVWKGGPQKRRTMEKFTVRMKRSKEERSLSDRTQPAACQKKKYECKGHGKKTDSVLSKRKKEYAS